MAWIKVEIGEGYRKKLPNGKQLEITHFRGKWISAIKMELLEDDNNTVLASSKKRYINLERFLSRELAEKITKRLFNKQSRKVCGYEIA